MNLKSFVLPCAALLMAAGSQAQQFVYTNGLKNALLEVQTSANCGLCPEGQQRVVQNIMPGNTNCIAVEFHTNDGLALPSDIFSAFAGLPCPNCGSGPKGTVDRSYFGHYYAFSTNPIYAYINDMDFWRTDAADAVDHPSIFNVAMNIDYSEISRQMVITVQAIANDSGYYRDCINAYIVEDSVSSVSYPQLSSLNSSPGSWYAGHGSPIEPAYYSHMGVVRKVLGQSIWGDFAFNYMIKGIRGQKTYTYTLPVGSNPKNIKVVGLVQYCDTNSAVTSRHIENCVVAKLAPLLSHPAGVNEAATSATAAIEILPNPATTYVNVMGTFNSPMVTKVAIIDMMGRVVEEKEYPASGTILSESIPVGNLSNGTYLIRVSNNEVSQTKQFVIKR